MKPIFFALPGNEDLARRLCAGLGGEWGELTVRRFPDGESHLRYGCDLRGRSVVLVCTLDRPDDKVIALYLAAGIARELGATSVGLVAPYLAYMRQDARFNPGEGITSAHFARLVSGFADWMVTVDPHLHRHAHLSEIYTIPTAVVHAALAISQWIRNEVRDPIVIGPDSESEQWAAEVAQGAGCPYMILQKERHGDRDVELSMPDANPLAQRTPVLVDDIASTARTLVAAVANLKHLHARQPACVVVHPIFADDAYEALTEAGADTIASCNTIAHSSNRIDIAPLLAAGIAGFLRPR